MGVNENFLKIVENHWSKQVDGTKMFCLVRKLKTLKGLRKLNREKFGNIEQNHKALRGVLKEKQETLHTDPLNITLQSEERAAAIEFRQGSIALESFYKQKSRMQWMKLGGQKTNFFHTLLKIRRNKQRITSLCDENGTAVNDESKIADVFLRFFKGMLGEEQTRTKKTSDVVFSKGMKLSTEQFMQKLRIQSFPSKIEKALDQMIWEWLF